MTASFSWNYSVLDSPDSPRTDTTNVDAQISTLQISATVNEMVEKTDLQQKSGFDDILFSFFIMDKQTVEITKQKPGEVSFFPSKKDKSLEVEVKVDYDEVKDLLRENRFKSFAIAQLFNALALTCKKYKVAAPLTPVEYAVGDKSRNSLPLTEAATFDLDEIDWLELNIPVSSYFGGNEKHANYELFEQLESVLLEKNLGYLEAFDAGAGYNTGFYKGKNSTKMVPVFRQVLQDLPKDSFIRIRHKGDEARIEQNEIKHWKWTKKHPIS